MTKIVNSWNDFDPLKHVIVGKADFDVAVNKVLGDEIEGSEEALRMFS